jgi:hypothetical protein
MSRLRRILAFLVVLLAPAAACAGTPLVEVHSGKETFRGKVLAHNGQLCWLMLQDGRVERLEIDSVQSFREAAPEFRSWSFSILRDKLIRELGKDFQFATTRHYLVAAATDAKARQYAEILEDVYRTFHLYFSVRSFKVADPEFPLVAIVFPNPASFARYAERDGVQAGAGLRGYYLTTSNRIALFEEGHPADSGLHDTMIHEGTHQVAFNTGLHTRVGATPKWVVEGLATVFEAPGIRNSSANLAPKARINPERLVWFGNYSKGRRAPKSLEAFLATDQMFAAQTLDAYSEAWSLTFFLIETRPRQYAKYLALLAARNPLVAYPPAARIADFKQAFGNDLALLEAEFLRFIGGIR